MSSQIIVEPESQLNDPNIRDQFPYKVNIRPPELSFYTALGISVLYRLSTVSKGMQKEVRWKILEYTNFELKKPNIDEDIVIPPHIQENSSKIDELLNIMSDGKMTIAEKDRQFRNRAIIICRAFQRILAAIFAKSNKILEAKEILEGKPVNYMNVYYFQNFAVSLSLKIVVRTIEDNPIESIDDTTNDKINVDIYCCDKRNNEYCIIKHIKDIEFLRHGNTALTNDWPFIIVRKKSHTPISGGNAAPSILPHQPGPGFGQQANLPNPMNPSISNQGYPQNYPQGAPQGFPPSVPSGGLTYQSGYPGPPGYPANIPGMPQPSPGPYGHPAQVAGNPPYYQGQPTGILPKVPSGGYQMASAMPPMSPMSPSGPPMPPMPPMPSTGPPMPYPGPPMPPCGPPITPSGPPMPPNPPASGPLPGSQVYPSVPPSINPDIRENSSQPIQLDQPTCELELTNYLLSLLNASLVVFTDSESKRLKKTIGKLKKQDKSKFSKEMKEINEKLANKCKEKHHPREFLIFKCGQRHCRSCLAASSSSRIICECRQDISFEDMVYLLGKQMNCALCGQSIEDIGQAVLQGQPMHKSCFVKSLNS